MACRAIYWSGTFILMATLTLCVECIGSLNRILAVNFMTIPAGRSLPFVFKGVMTVNTCDTVSRLGNMHFMVEKDIARRALKHDSDWFFRGLDREGGITDYPHDKEYDRKAICNDSLCFDFHVIFPLCNGGNS